MAINKNKVMEAARKAVEKGQVDKAIKEYLKVVREDPKDVRVWLKIGDLYAKKGAKQEATETYLKVAKFYSEQGFYLKAVAVYKQILKLDPRMVEVNLKLAELYRQLGLLSDAMQHFEMVAAHFHREGKTKEALATIRQLVDLDPENVATRIKLAELYSKEGMLEEAATEFSHACDYLRKHNRFDDYIKVAERLLWHKSEDIELARELAGIYLQRNDPRRALQKLQACFKADPRDVETLALLAQAFQALDQKGKTVSVLKELARILTENGQRGQAEEVHRKILAFVPDDPDSRAFLGMTGEPPAASEDLELPADVIESSQPVQRQPGMGNPTGSMPIVDPAQSGNLYGSSPMAPQAPQPPQPPPPPQPPQAYEPPPEDFAAELSLDEESSYEADSSVPGEVHSDEIIKILTETDVYVKYGLHQKAVEHLRRVFELDPENLEARERLKEILLSQGREEEAVAELMQLAEQAAHAQPDRAEQYLREVLSIDASHQEAYELAQRYRLNITGSSGVEIIDDSDAIELDVDAMGQGNVAQVSEEELAFEDLGFDEAAEHLPPDALRPESFQGEAYQQAPYPPGYQQGGYPQEPYAQEPYAHSYPPESYPPEQLPPEHLPPDELPPERLPPDEFADLGVAPEGEPTPHQSDPGYGYAPPEQPAQPDDGTMEVAMDQVEEAVSIAEIDADDLVFEAEPEAEPPPFDPEDARAFDAEVHSNPPEADPSAFAAEPIGFEDGFEMTDGDRPAMVDPTRQTEALPDMDLDNADPTGPETDEGPQSTALEDELDEADFYITEGLFDEARRVLETLLGRYPNHPLVLAKLRDVDSMVEGGEPEVEGPPSQPGMDTLDEPARGEATGESKPAVMLEKPIDDEDADTHYDLGLAYKEMGLYAEAMKAFEKVINVPGREVQCNLMIGLCHREQGNLSEAINQFKAGLYVDTISDAERFGLYYEIGLSYEQLNDPQEALYYYEMILKKDPSYRDVAQRVSAIKSALGGEGGGGNGTRQRKSTLDDETDAALDQVLAEGGDSPKV